MEMIKHVILWKIKEEYDESKKEEIRNGVKTSLEDLKGKIPGLIDIRVQAEMLPTSNADVMLDSTFESVEALKGYATHKEHVKAADDFVRPYMEVRLCMDYEVK